MTTAIALKQRGISVTVYEAAPELRAVGAGIIMATNAMQVLHRLGIANKIKEKGYKLNGGQIADEQWRTLQHIDGQYAIDKYGVGSYAIHRASLQQILFDELSEGTVKLNHKVASVLQSENKVRVKFENGSEVEADFVIGADGIKSVVRQALFGKTNYRYSGQTCWRATIKMPVPKKLESVAYELWGNKAGLRLGMVPVNPNEVYYYATVCAPAAGKDDPCTLKENLNRLFSEFGEIATQFFSTTELTKIIRTDIYDFAPIKKWSKGRVALIGDAAHATTPNLGQGGCQAIEDAYVIAKALFEDKEPEKSFENFQTMRYAKAKYVVDTSWQFGKLTNLSPRMLIKLRNTAIRLMPSSAGRKSADKLFRLNY